MKVAVIGAGISGLVSIKEALAYGFDVVCFERSKDIGGLWSGNKDDENATSVTKATVTNTSKEMMAFSDFPPPDDFPLFMHNTRYLSYIEMYAKYYNLKNYIKFETSVLLVKRSANYCDSGQWDVTYEDKIHGQTSTETFDGVFVANGHQKPFLPSIEGIEKFSGSVLHSQSCSGSMNVEGRRVLIIGFGNSAADNAVELAPSAAQVYIATRSGCWYTSRIGFFGYPYDMILVTRFSLWLAGTFKRLYSVILGFILNFNIDHKLYGLTSTRGVLTQVPLINDMLPSCIINGSVIIKPDVKRFLAGNKVEFEDGSVVDRIDDVIMCTGYWNDLPFLNEYDQSNIHSTNLPYKYMYPVWTSKNCRSNAKAENREHNTLAFVGLPMARVALAPVYEMQGRFHCEVLNGAVHLPNYKKMIQEMEKISFLEHYPLQIIDWMDYLDDLASRIGAKPRISRYLFTDPRFALKLIFSPVVPYQFRLQGPQAWPGAKNAIMTLWDRSFAQMKKGRRHHCGAILDEKRVISPFTLENFGLFIFCLSILFAIFAFYF